ncbi:MAG: OmpA family protein [Burkholderiales bacterium]|nr:OmpA family protein [Burkholderiales bacterium]MDE1928400.1 OmpA family protein [Burkholderiales bacterium]MDE2158300.1 OmpA family protein [Burkholderiales bacterium]MDE2504161.1 OmpA family protein [Burkholderiales bacterium]
MDENDEGARVGLWVVMGIITLLLFGIIGGLVVRQMHLAAAPAAAPAAAADTGALADVPLTGELLGKVYFDLGSAALPPAAAATLKAVLAAVDQAGPGARIVLAGFHDPSGDAAQNEELAKQRALAVRAALQAVGLDAARVLLHKPESTTGNGAATEARRVEIRLVP